WANTEIRAFNYRTRLVFHIFSAKERRERVTQDIIVVGGGLAGLCAALEAAENRARVLLLEKQQTLGGSTKLSGGSVAFAGTEHQKKQGIEDSSDLLGRDML